MCSEQKYQEEIVAVQREQRVSTQAKVIVNKNYPRVKMNYAPMIKVNGAKSDGAGTSQRREAHESQRSRVESSAPEEVEVVCMHPDSGCLITQTVDLQEESRASDERGDRTSKNNAFVRSEVREIYDQQTRESEQEDYRDVEKYETTQSREKR